MASVMLARDFLLSSKSAGRALCVSADVLPAGCKREMIYNVFDGCVGPSSVFGSGGPDVPTL
jgi:hypothetical protein